MSQLKSRAHKHIKGKFLTRKQFALLRNNTEKHQPNAQLDAAGMHALTVGRVFLYLCPPPLPSKRRHA